MEAGDSIVPEDDEQPRGGILSTLESVRQRKPMPGLRPARPRKNWQTRALVGLMGFGVLVLLGSFIMVVRHGQSPQQAAELSAATEQAVLRTADAGASLPVVGNPEAAAAITPAAPSAAVIENPDGNPLAALGPAAPSRSTTATASATQAPATAPAAITAITALAPPSTPPSARADPPAVARADAPHSPAKTRRSSASKHPADADVALLEAMLSHTPSRAGTPAAVAPVAEQLSTTCGSLSGAAAATCRARICVNNPGAPACHGGE